jgi:hypothetical protein
MTRHVIGALLVLAAQNVWAFNGCPPASADADKCETGIVKALGKFGGAVIKCHAKQADGAFKQKPVDEETCEETGPKSAKGKLEATIAKTAATCPPEAVANAATVSAGLLSGAGSLDVQNGLVYCDNSSGTAIDPSGDDAGFVPSPDPDSLKCSDGVGKDLAKLWSARVKCSTKAADSAFKGKAFDETACRTTARGKYDAAAGKLIAKGGCPACLNAGSQSSLGDALLAQLDTIDGQIFVCPASTTTTTTVATPTTTTTSLHTTTTTTTTTGPTTTTSTPGSTTTTSTTPSTTTTSMTPTTTTTSTTMASITSCPAGGQVDVISTLVPNINTFSSGQIGGIKVEVGYPASVSMPGTQFLTVGDPTDPATLIVLLQSTPGAINLYDGLVTFFDADSPPSPFVLSTLLTLNQPNPPGDPFGANLIFNVGPVPFERARFTCTPGAALSVTSFTCSVTQEVTPIGGTIDPTGRPPCVLGLHSPS